MVAAIAGCSGDSGVIGSGGTGGAAPAGDVGTISLGPITGFGSIIVNGIRYDDASASLSSDDSGGLARSDLRLGMVVEVRGRANPSSGMGTATSVAVRSELKGVVQDRTATAFLLLGTTVRTDANTVFDNAADVVDGDFVEVYGAYDPTNRSLRATRVEKKSFGEHKLHGIVSGLDIVARRFSLGPILIDYGNAGDIPGIADGVEIQVYGAAPGATGPWSISRATLRGRLSVASASRVEIEAVIEAFSSIASFRVAGLDVDGSGALIEGGAASQLATGVRVEVKGDVQGSTVKATRIKIEDGSGGSGGSGSGSEFEVKGRIESLTSVASFVVRGTRIDASGAVSFERGTAAQLTTGACIEVKGVLSATPAGSSVRASTIKFDDDC